MAAGTTKALTRSTSGTKTARVGGSGRNGQRWLSRGSLECGSRVILSEAKDLHVQIPRFARNDIYFFSPPACTAFGGVSRFHTNRLKKSPILLNVTTQFS